MIKKTILYISSLALLVLLASHALGVQAQGTTNAGSCGIMANSDEYDCRSAAEIKPSSCSWYPGKENMWGFGFSCKVLPAGYSYSGPAIGVDMGVDGIGNDIGGVGTTRFPIYWSATQGVASDPVSCTSSDFSTGGAREGKVSVGPFSAAGSKILSVTCKNSAVSKTASVTLTIEKNTGYCEFSVGNQFSPSNSLSAYICHANTGEKPAACTYVREATPAMGYVCSKVPSGYTPPKIEVRVTASPTSGKAGVVNPTISWKASNAASDPTLCTITGVVNGGPAEGNASTGIINTPGSTKYSISCKNSAAEGIGEVNITVSPANQTTGGAVEGQPTNGTTEGAGGAGGQTRSTDGTLKYTPLEPLPGLDKAANVDFAAMLNLLFKLLITVAALFSVGTLVWGGVMYMISDAFETKDTAKKRMRAAIFGLLIILSSWLILNTINPQLRIFQLNVKDSPGGAASGQNPSGGAPAAQQSAVKCSDGQSEYFKPDETVGCR